MKKQFDLTTEGGMADSSNFLNSKLFTHLSGNTINSFVLKTAMQVLESVMSTTESMLQEQRKTAIDIIKAGKESGAESMEVTVDQQVGLHFGSNVDGIPIKATIGKSGNMTIKVTYK